MTQEMKNKREDLKALSRQVQPNWKTGKFKTVNDALVNYYKQQGHTTLHSFKTWLSEGFCVRRGEKALLLWGQPHKAKNNKKEGTDKDEFDYFPLAYVFSEKQVDKLN